MNAYSSTRRSLALLSSRDRRILLGAAVVQSGLGLLDLVAVLLLGLVASQSIDGAATDSGSNIAGRSLSPLLENVTPLGLAAIAGSLLVIKSLASLFLSRRIYSFIANRQAVVAADLSNRLLHLPLVEIQRRASQEAVYALSGGMLAATVGTLGAATVVVAEVTLSVLLVAGLFFVDPLVAIFCIIFFGVIAFVLQVFLGRWAFALGARGADAEIRGASALQHALRAYREVSVSGRRQNFIESFSARRWEAARVQADYFVLSQVSKYTFEIGLVLGGGLLVLVALTTGNMAAAVGTLTVFLLVAARVFPSLLRIQGMLSTIRNSSGLATATFTLRDEIFEAEGRLTKGSFGDSELRHEHTISDREDFVANICIDNVTLRYPGNQVPALSDICLQIGAGQSVALVGPTGSGKTTLVDVVLGVLNPDHGSVVISNNSPSEVVATWPGAMAYVPQDVAILSGTIRENVALGVPLEEVRDDQVWKSLEKAHIADFVRSRPDGLDTTVGEHGMKLSGGQRQRIGLARALYSDPMLLVLDEATSALDAETERVVTEALQEFAGQVTMLVVAHRLSTIRSCDQVVYLNEGRVLGVGTFAQLRESVPDFDSHARLMGL